MDYSSKVKLGTFMSLDKCSKAPIDLAKYSGLCVSKWVFGIPEKTESPYGVFRACI